MSSMASQITSVSIVYSTVYSSADQRNIRAPRHWPLCGQSGEFSAQRVSNAENVSIWWRHHDGIQYIMLWLMQSMLLAHHCWYMPCGMWWDSLTVRQCPKWPFTIHARQCIISVEYRPLRQQQMTNTYRQTSQISRTKSQNLNLSRLVLRLSLPNPLKPGVKSRMKMELEDGSNCIWVIIFIAYSGATYIRGLTIFYC